MRVLLTGATGFVGSYLLKMLLAEEHSVCLLKRSFSKTDRIDDCMNRCVVYDIDRISIAQIFEENQIECIIHCATFYGRGDNECFKNIEANLLFPLELLSYGCERDLLCFINTDSFFTKQIQMDADLDNVFYMEGYTLSKLQFCQWGHIFAKKYGIRFVNMRLEHVYGANDAPGKFIPFVEQKCRENVPVLELSEGIQTRDFIHVSDVVAAYQIVLKSLQEKRQEGYVEYQVGTGVSRSLKEFVSIIHQALNSQTELKWGAVETKNGELMESKADITELSKLGWKPEIVSKKQIEKTFVVAWGGGKFY